jgi:hypothetical protein
MKQLLMAAAVAAVSITTTIPAAVAADVGVSISVGQPGFYGQLDIGDYPRPQVLYAQPVIVDRVQYERPPVYMRVPPGHAKHWSKHCREYNACGERVMFVRDDWYNHEYAPRYRERHGDGGDHGGNDHGGNDHGGNDHGDHGNNDHGDHGGNGHGKDHGHNH